MLYVNMIVSHSIRNRLIPKNITHNIICLRVVLEDVEKLFHFSYFFHLPTYRISCSLEAKYREIIKFSFPHRIVAKVHPHPYLRPCPVQRLKTVQSKEGMRAEKLVITAISPRQ